MLKFTYKYIEIYLNMSLLLTFFLNVLELSALRQWGQSLGNEELKCLKRQK